MPRFRPRISLASALLLMTIVGMALVIFLQWRDVGPLRAEVNRLRTELGQLNIDDPTKAYAIQLQTGEPRHWKWRIYLPPGGKYRQLCYSGTLPSRDEFHGAAWYEQVEGGGIGSGMSGSIDAGEFTLEAKLENDGSDWVVRIDESGGRGSMKTSVTQPSGDWLSDPGHFSSSSDASPSQQTVFEPGQPIMLLKVLKPIITKFTGGYSSRDPEGAADGFVLWIEQPSPPPSAEPAQP